MRQGLPGERQRSPRLLLGPSEDQAFKNKVCKTEDQDPRQEELAGPRRQGPGKRSLPGRPSQSIKTPASGVCREGRSRLKVTSLTRDPDKRGLQDWKITSLETRLGAICAPAGPGERQAPEPGKFPGPARSRPRQGTCRGGLRCVPALQLIGPRVALGSIPGTRGGWLCSLGDTVALHRSEAIAVANGDAVADAFGVDGDGH